MRHTAYVRAEPSAWHAPPATPTIARDTVHIWRADLDRPAYQQARFRQLLSIDEVARASRYRFARDHERFIVARGLLRVILSRYLTVQPQDLQFEYSPHGKPALSAAHGHQSLSFNVSHSNGVALYAIANERTIGVDIERIRAGVATGALATRCFTPAEQAHLASLPIQEQPQAFFTYWTLKEAYLKARGVGLAGSLDQISIALPLDEAAQNPILHDHAAERAWSLRTLIPRSGYRASLAVEGHDWQLACWDSA